MVSNYNNDDSVQLLAKLGLSVLQAKIYLTLLASNANTAREISAISKISRPDVYRVLDELEQNSFVEKTIANPTKYIAIPIEVCMPRLMLKKTKEFEEIRKQIPLLIQNLKDATNKNPASSKNEFALISKGTMILELEKKTKQAKESIFVIAPANRVIFNKIENLQSAFEDALLRNVDIRLVLIEPQSDKLKEMISKREHSFSNFQTTYASQLSNVTIGIFDGKETLIGTQPLDSPIFSFLWSSNNCLISLCQAYFNSQWKK